MWANRKLLLCVVVSAGVVGLVGLAIADNGPTGGASIPTVNGRPLVNPSDSSNYQTVDGRPLRQPVSGTQPPQPSMWSKMGTSTKNFFSRVGNLFSSNDSTSSTANPGLRRPSTAASKKDYDAAEKVDINGSQIPIGYNADGSKR